MAEMKTERKSVLEYLSKNKFLIPMYQRAYIWEEDECEQLWEDIFSFFSSEPNENDEYFLGSVVIYKENNKQNIIDGQQRTTTLSLLIRALYEKATNQQNKNISELISKLSSCLWDRNQLNGEIDFKKPHLQSEVAIDSDNNLLEKILSNGYKFEKEEIENVIKKSSSNYEKNYLFFIKKIDELAQEYPADWFNFCLTLLNSCIVLPIECDGQENALRIFNTLNNRGVSLSVSDIFKGLIFTSKRNDQERKEFATEWKKLEEKITNSYYLNKENIGFLFTQYEHIIRALNNEVDTVIPSTLDFFTKKDKANSKNKKVNFAANEGLLNKNETFVFIQELAEFWCNPKDYFSLQAQKYFDILNIYQNKLWQMVVSMCFYEYKPKKNNGDESNIFDIILPQLVSYCALGLIYGKGGSSGLFWGFMKANILIHERKKKIFEPSLNIPELVMPQIDYFTSFCVKALSKQIRYILVIYTLIYDENQEWEWNADKKNYSVIKGEIEHIFPKKWTEANYAGWNEKDAEKFLEYIGNKTLLEKKQNIQASNEYFAKKKPQYQKSKFLEAQNLGKSLKNDWLKEDIEARNEEIYKNLKTFFEKNL
ncbi:DUF262 domain-containing HNH endonuclease family protein [Helicobacter sp. MIT 21-1697]|uniref:DUF262 domain-containing protein n=1 Tax=Helicobacter sp. MIT 21-1697 TaxID=2993733 RepID=UPI00224AB336|nr:DUF262 domain-containing HNH endonuclease family protein [Helicobacter sp. MIT 21-1697]MCX2717445.1 DUF262 domain-containing HNH endonuclease family protein [Helicobacter sp. MIT 21-1697]